MFLLFLLPPVLAVILSFAIFACSCGSACGSGCGEGGVVITVTFLVSVLSFVPSCQGCHNFLIFCVPYTMFLMFLMAALSTVPTLDFALCSEHEEQKR